MAFKVKRVTTIPDPVVEVLIPNNIVHSLGVITATFDFGSMACTLAGLTENTLYYLYKIDSSADLQFTTDAPSVYRVTFPEAIIVGAFYSDGYSPVAFGAFVNVEGPPSCSMFDSQRVVIDGTGGPPTKPTSAVDRISWGRNGGFMTLKWEYKHDAITGGAIGSGFLLPRMPTNLKINTAVMADATTVSEIANERIHATLTTGYITNESTVGHMAIIVYDEDHFTTEGNGNFSTIDPWSSTFYDLQQANVGFGFIVTVPIQGWTSTALKDL